ncbi:hypothetical protein E0H70_15990 [Rhizobium leguminosarum bv. viciae]|nr:hypothetical protein E0H70_15990 [Rhizobium leguminosarum bv. viciae]
MGRLEVREGTVGISVDFFLGSSLDPYFADGVTLEVKSAEGKNYPKAPFPIVMIDTWSRGHKPSGRVTCGERRLPDLSIGDMGNTFRFGAGGVDAVERLRSWRNVFDLSPGCSGCARVRRRTGSAPHRPPQEGRHGKGC